jgi:hypothetical protein
MSGPNRQERLENEIVEALRRAPGPTPSAELDARILASAHAAVAKVAPRRAQPRWLSMAAGLVVLVGSGLALRIWQQVEHAPTALDAPPSISSESTVATRVETADDREVSGGAGPDSAAAPAADMAAAPITTQSRAQIPEVAAKRAEKPASVAAKALRQDEAGPGLRDQRVAPAAAGNAASPQPRPFPAESTPKVTGERSRSAADTMAPARAPAAQPVPLPSPPPPPVPAPVTTEVATMIAAPAPPMEPQAAPRQPDSSELAKFRRDAGPAPVLELGREDQTDTRSNFSSEGAAGMMAEEAPLPSTPSTSATESVSGQLMPGAADKLAGADRSDAFVEGVAAARRALAAGDSRELQKILSRLRRDFPQQRLPDDLRGIDDADH